MALNSVPRVFFYTCLPQGVCIAGRSDLVCLHYIVCSYNIDYGCYFIYKKYYINGALFSPLFAQVKIHSLIAAI